LRGLTQKKENEINRLRQLCALGETDERPNKTRRGANKKEFTARTGGKGNYRGKGKKSVGG